MFKGEVYKSKDYGLVKYLGTCQTNRGGAGFCYKFETTHRRNSIKYIQPDELRTFLESNHAV